MEKKTSFKLARAITDTVSVYTNKRYQRATWILEGSFTVPSAGGTVSIF